MNNKKRFMCMLMSAIIIVMNVSIMYAAQEMDIANGHSKEEQYYKQIGAILGHFGYSAEDEIYCSQLMEVYSCDKEESDEQAMLVFEDEEVIGVMTSFDVEGEIAYSFIYSEYEEISQSIEHDEEILLINTEEQMLCITENKETVIMGDTDILDEEVKEKSRKSEKYATRIEKDKLPENISFETTEDYIVSNENDNEIIEAYQASNQSYAIATTSEMTYNTYMPKISDIDISKSYLSTDSYTSYLFRYVPYVANEDINGGLCWTACGAMISRFYGRGSYTANGLYKKMVDVYGGTPLGNKEWEEKMYDMLNLKYLYYARKLSYGEVFQALKSGRLIHMGIKKYDGIYSYNAHAIILCGSFYSPSDDKHYYIYRDPNKNGFVVNSVIKSTLNTSYGNVFYYRIGDTIYNNWITTFIVYK